MNKAHINNYASIFSITIRVIPNFTAVYATKTELAAVTPSYRRNHFGKNATFLTQCCMALNGLNITYLPLPAFARRKSFPPNGSPSSLAVLPSHVPLSPDRAKRPQKFESCRPMLPWPSKTPGRIQKSHSTCPKAYDPGGEPQKLFVASMVDERDDLTIHAFLAVTAASEAEFRRKLLLKAGYRTARTATIFMGFDPSEPIAASLLSDSVADILLDVGRDPHSVLAAGLEVFVEQRFT